MSKPIFQYDETHRLLVCQACEDVLGAREIKAHLNRPRHKRAKVAERLPRKALRARLRDLWHPVAQFMPSSDPVPRFAGLRVWTDGLRCDVVGCGFMTRREKYMRLHRERHEPLDSSWTGGHHCQKVQSRGRGGVFVEVLPHEAVEIELEIAQPASEPTSPTGYTPPTTQEVKGGSLNLIFHYRTHRYTALLDNI